MARSDVLPYSGRSAMVVPKVLLVGQNRSCNDSLCHWSGICKYPDAGRDCKIARHYPDNYDSVGYSDDALRLHIQNQRSGSASTSCNEWCDFGLRSGCRRISALRARYYPGHRGWWYDSRKMYGWNAQCCGNQGGLAH